MVAVAAEVAPEGPSNSPPHPFRRGQYTASVARDRLLSSVHVICIPPGRALNVSLLIPPDDPTAWACSCSVPPAFVNEGLSSKFSSPAAVTDPTRCLWPSLTTYTS